MKRAKIFGLALLFAAFTVHANGPANKATGSFIYGNFVVDFTAHEGVTMKNGKTRPAKGMLTAYHLTNSNRYYAVNVICVNVINETDAVFVGPVVMAGSDWESWIGDYRLNWAHDSGEPGAYADELHMRLEEDPEIAMAFCTEPDVTITNTQSAGKHWMPDEGNIQVHYRAPD